MVHEGKGMLVDLSKEGLVEEDSIGNGTEHWA
jgi:hypothetical protein